MRRFVLSLTFGLLTALVLVGCGGGSDTKDNDAPAPGKDQHEKIKGGLKAFKPKDNKVE